MFCIVIYLCHLLSDMSHVAYITCLLVLCDAGHTLASLFTLKILLPTMCHQTTRKTIGSKKQHSPIQPNFVRVNGRYRVGKILGSGGSGECNSTQVQHRL